MTGKQLPLALQERLVPKIAAFMKNSRTYLAPVLTNHHIPSFLFITAEL
jgi:hypothetical protein